MVKEIFKKVVLYIKTHGYQLSLSVAAFAVFFCIEPAWHGVCKMPDSLRKEINGED